MQLLVQFCAPSGNKRAQSAKAQGLVGVGLACYDEFSVGTSRGCPVEYIFCPACRQRQPSAHTYCFRCGEALPVELLPEDPAKRTRFFAGVKVGDDDPDAGFLRVTCYLREQQFDAPEGSVTIPGHHVRFSFWENDKARCVLSIPEAEGRELARFITQEMGRLNRSSKLTT